MAIATRPPEIPVLEPGRAQPKRRWPKLLALTVVVILLVVAAGLFVWLDHYEPLTLGSGVYGVTPGSQVVASFDAYGPDVDFRQSYVRWDVGRTIHMQFPVWNEGRVPVTIDGVLGDQTPREGPVDVRITAWGAVDGPSGMTSPASSPITLAPGEGIQVLVDVTMVKHMPAASGSIISTVDMTYSTFGVHHRVTMPMGLTLYLCGGACPPT